MVSIREWQVALACCLSVAVATFVWGGTEEHPPGKTVRVFDPYEQGAQAPNPLYLKSLTRKPWWHAQAEHRLPVLVTEPIGLNRLKAPVSVFHEFPAGTVPQSIHVVTPYGKELPCQVEVRDAEKNLFEVVFLVTIRGKGQAPFFIYYGPRPVETQSTAEADDVLSVRQTARALRVSNNRLSVEFNKVTGADGMDVFRSIRPHGARYSQLSRYRQRELGPGAEAKVVEDGPIRKTIAYGEASLYSVYAASPLVCYSRKSRFSRAIQFLPGGDTVNDTLYYETRDGLKAMPINYTGGNTVPVMYELTPHLKEPWIVFHDYREQQMVGDFYDARARGRTRAMTLADGYWLMWNAAGPLQGAIYTDRESNILKAREVYVAWKNPLMLTVGEPQPKVTITPRVPVLGEDFILMHLLNGRYWRRSDENTVRRWVDEVKEYGGNYGMHWSYQFDYDSKVVENKSGGCLLDEIIEVAHREGIGVSKGHTVKGSAEIVKELAEHGVDCIWLSDEWSWSTKELTDEDKAEFRKLYQMDPPASLRTKDLSDPAQFNFFRYRMLRTNRYHAELAKPGLEVNPKLMVTQTTSPNNLTINEERSPQDLEKLAEVQSFLNMDLYSTFPSFVGPCVKLTRAAMGNTKPCLIISGYCGWDAHDPVELNQYLQLLYGANALAYFILNRVCNPEPGLGAKDAYNFIDYTGLGDLMAKARPLPFVGILRDRDEFFAGLKRGEYTPGRQSDYDAKIRQHILALGNIPSDIVYSKYAKPDLLKPYRVMVVPHDPVMSDDLAKALHAYVAEGGSLIIEGETINNPTMAALAKVKRAGTTTDVECEVEGAASPLQGISFSFAGKCVPIEAEEGCEVLAAAGGQSMVTLASHGKSKVVCVAPFVGLQVNDVDGLRASLRKLVEHVVGYVPMKVLPKEQEDDILANVFTSQGRYLLAAFNQSSRDAKEFSLRLSGLPEGSDALLSVRRGTMADITDGVAVGLKLSPKEVDFYRLGKKGEFEIPKTVVQTRAGLAQAITPGMAFLKQEPLPEESVAKKRKKEPGVIYVAVFKTPKKKLVPCEMGVQAMLEATSKLPKVKLEPIADLEPYTISFYDVVIVPNIYDNTEITEGWEKNVREYAEKGGGLMLIHHAVGYRECSDASLLFPEIAIGTGFTAITKIEILEDHPIVTAAAFHERFKNDINNPAFAHVYSEPVMKKGEVIDTGFPDYIVLRKGKSGQVIAKSVRQAGKGGTPAIVVGEAGKGRVVVCGMGIGCKGAKVEGKYQFEEAVTQGEKNILTNSIYWLGQKVSR